MTDSRLGFMTGERTPVVISLTYGFVTRVLMSITNSAAIIAAFLAGAQFVSVGLAAFRCRHPLNEAQAPDLAPGITLVRPLRGIEYSSRETLAASLVLTYPLHEVLFCVADAGDPIVQLVEDAISAHPNVDARLLIGADCIGANPKLNNMMKGWRQAKYPWTCFTDSNLLPPPDYLQRLVATWRPGTGAVSAPPAGSAPDGFWGEFECAFLNTFEARWQYAIDTLGLGFCQGKTLFLNRALLAGRGLQALADEPAEDAAMTNIVREQGLRVRLVSPPFPQPIGARTLQDVWSRQVRWARLRRATFPLHYAPEIFLGFVPAGLALALAVQGNGWWIAGSLSTLFVAWFGSEAVLAALAGWPWTLSSLAASVLRDLLMPALWCAAWAGNRFTWHGAALSASDPQQSLEPQ